MKKPKGVRSVKLVGVSLEDIFAKDARIWGDSRVTFPVWVSPPLKYL